MIRGRLIVNYRRYGCVPYPEWRDELYELGIEHLRHFETLTVTNSHRAKARYDYLEKFMLTYPKNIVIIIFNGQRVSFFYPPPEFRLDPSYIYFWVV